MEPWEGALGTRAVPSLTQAFAFGDVRACKNCTRLPFQSEGARVVQVCAPLGGVRCRVQKAMRSEAMTARGALAWLVGRVPNPVQLVLGEYEGGVLRVSFGPPNVG